MKCQAKTRDGNPCRNSALENSNYCGVHVHLESEGSSDKHDTSTLHPGSHSESAENTASQEDKKQDSYLKESNRSHLRTFTSAVAMLAGTCSVLVSLYMFPRITDIKPLGAGSQTQQSIESIREEMSINYGKITALADKFGNLDNKLSMIVSAPTSTDGSLQIAAMKSDLKAMSTRIKSLEEGLIENPEKALSTVLLRRDLGSLETKLLEAIADAEKDVDRIYDQNKWFLGLMVTTALGLIGVAVSNLIQTKNTS